ncbi:ribosomal protein L24 [Chloropicon primus]|uniref:Ribosomal protein L24 n=1 Tax=Chloropicon primus TaxID=1764295 RepID=A0A5B8MVX6_9CHLO|nr:ribosomal protein L24 [Chloropicon primus]UPR03785.1 ribosomal protein L24 [Chloropicon primus]|eukprot:QDZ24577.1 ribosomal protein L24 [Chloropicon primus]
MGGREHNINRTNTNTNTRREVTAMAVKKWVKPQVNNNTGKAVRTEMHVREGDTVKVIAGKDKGKVGEVVKVYRKGLKAGQILVDDVNLVKKAIKPKSTMGGEEERGKIILTEAPIHHSNVMLFSKTKEVVSRVGHKVVGGKKLRYLVKTGEVLQEVPRKVQPQKEEDAEASDE